MMSFLPKRLFLGGVLVLAFLTGCAQDSATYSNKTYGFQVRYPSDWKFKENINGTVVTFIAPKSSKFAAFQENLNIIVQDLSAHPLSLKEYSKQAVGQLTAMYNNVEILDTDSIIMSNLPATKIEYLMKAEFKIKLIQVWTVKDKKAYLITFSADADRFDQYKGKAMGIIKSFKLK